MKSLEVIQIRTLMETGEKIGGVLVGEIKMKMRTYRNLLNVRLLKNAQNYSDITMVLEWQGALDGARGSMLGGQLVDSLREIGLVEHSVWKELE